jgi:hypothetical protein
MIIPIYFGQRKLFVGAASVELVILLLPILLLLIVGADFARVMHGLVALDSAVRVGVTTGAQLLNQTNESGDPIYFAEDTDGDITFPADDSGHDVFYYILKAAQADAAPYPMADDDVTISAWCRCPEYDPSFRSGGANFGQSSALVANCANDDDVLRNCETRPPEILLQVTVESQIEPILGARWVFPEVQQLSRSAVISAR